MLMPYNSSSIGHGVEKRSHKKRTPQPAGRNCVAIEDMVSRRWWAYDCEKPVLSGPMNNCDCKERIGVVCKYRVSDETGSLDYFRVYNTFPLNLFKILFF